MKLNLRATLLHANSPANASSRFTALPQWGQEGGRSQEQHLESLCLKGNVLREFLGRLGDRLLPSEFKCLLNGYYVQALAPDDLARNKADDGPGQIRK